MRYFFMAVLGFYVTVCLRAPAADVFITNSEKGAVEDYLETSADRAEFLTRDDGSRYLALPVDASQVSFNPAYVEPEVKYKLSFRGRIESDFTVEKNCRAHIEALQRPRLRLTCYYEILFYDKDGEELNVPGYDAGGFILTSEWHDYVHVFYTPPGAETLEINFMPAGRQVFIDNVKIGKETEEGTLNPNPDFRYGELNYCGWRPLRGGRLYERPDGTVVLHPGQRGSSPFFPLNDDQEYEMYGRGNGGTVQILYFDNEGNRIHNRFLLRLSEEGESVTLNPPDGTRMGRLHFRNVNALKEFRVNRR